MDSRSRIRAALVLGGLAVAALVTAWAIRDGTGQDAAPTVAANEASEASARGRAATVATPAAVPDRPLPPVGTPFRLTIEDLQARARAGDAAAMCRLAAEHSNCRFIRAQLDDTGRMLDMQQDGTMSISFDEPGQRARFMEQFEARAEALIERSRQCDGVPDIGTRELARQWRAAALAGNAKAIEYYVSGAAFPMDEWLSLLPELALYREEAEPLARRLVDSGNVAAARLLGTAYLPDAGRHGSPLLGQAVDPDPVEAFALLDFWISREKAQANGRVPRFLQAQLQRLEQVLSPTERDQAARRRAALEALSPASAGGSMRELYQPDPGACADG